MIDSLLNNIWELFDSTLLAIITICSIISAYYGRLDHIMYYGKRTKKKKRKIKHT